MDDLNSFLRPSSESFWQQGKEIVEDTVRRLREAFNSEVGLVGTIFIPASPLEDDAAVVGADFSYGPKEHMLEHLSSLIAEMAFRFADSPEDIWSTIQGIANQAQEDAKCRLESA